MSESADHPPKVSTATAVSVEDVHPRGIWRMFVYSAIGVFAFFVPVTYKGTSTIVLDHLVTIFQDVAEPIVPWIITAFACLGTGVSILDKRWTKGVMPAVFTLANCVGLVICVLWVTGNLPAVLAQDDLVPFLWEKIAVPVGLIVPIGALFLSLLLSYGILEFVGVFMQPIMRPAFHTPGRSAIDAVASFVGSYSLGLLITDRVYRNGGYTGREASIVAIGFSTVSAAFMVIVANALDLMDHWLLYFFSALIITFLVTAITVHLPPISRITEDYYPGATPNPEQKVTGNRFAVAWREAKLALSEAPSLARNLWINLVDGVRMSSAIVPSILSIGLAGLLLEKYTPVFDWVGYLFYPFMWLVHLPAPDVAGPAVAVGIAEMFLPASVVAGHESLVLRFVIAIVSVSAIIFFSALVPAVLATKIPLKIWQLVVVWFIRCVLTILIATPVAYLLVGGVVP